MCMEFMQIPLILSLLLGDFNQIVAFATWLVFFPSFFDSWSLLLLLFFFFFFFRSDAMLGDKPLCHMLQV